MYFICVHMFVSYIHTEYGLDIFRISLYKIWMRWCGFWFSSYMRRIAQKVFNRCSHNANIQNIYAGYPPESPRYCISTYIRWMQSLPPAFHISVVSECLSRYVAGYALDTLLLWPTQDTNEDQGDQMERI